MFMFTSKKNFKISSGKVLLKGIVTAVQIWPFVALVLVWAHNQPTIVR